LEVMFKIIDFMGQILSFPTYNGSPVVQAPNYSSFYMGWVVFWYIYFIPQFFETPDDG
jgi:hypothetical protein